MKNSKKPLTEISKKMKKGAFREWCKRQGYSKVTRECIAKGKKSKNPTTRRRANLAATFARYRKHAAGGMLGDAAGPMSASSPMMLAFAAANALFRKGFLNYDAAQQDISRIGAITETYGYGGKMKEKEYAEGGPLPGMAMMEGPSHEEGGIPVTVNGTPTRISDQEVEGGEVIAPVILGGKKVNYVFSDRLGIGGRSFAELAKEVMDKYKDPEDRLQWNAANFELRRLALMNEGARATEALRQIASRIAASDGDGAVPPARQPAQRFQSGGSLGHLPGEQTTAAMAAAAAAAVPPVDAVMQALGYPVPSSGQDPVAMDDGGLPFRFGKDNPIARGFRAVKGFVMDAAAKVEERYREKPNRLATDTAVLRYLTEAALLIPQARKEVPRTNPYASDVLRRIDEARVSYDALLQGVAQQAQAAYLQGRGQRSAAARMATNAATTAAAIKGASEGILKGEMTNAQLGMSGAQLLARIGTADQQALLEYDNRMAQNEAQRRNLLRSLLANINLTAADAAQKEQQRRMALANIGMMSVATPSVQVDLGEWDKYLRGISDRVPGLRYDLSALRRAAGIRDKDPLLNE